MAGSTSLLAGVTLLCCLTISYQYSMGPPESACEDGEPKHQDNLPANQTTSPCPYLVLFDKFIPGVPHILNITSWSERDKFKGYQLTVFDGEDNPVGDFSSDQRTICEGAAATHSEASDKLYAEVTWTPPMNSSSQVYHIWLTVVKNFTTFWVDCDPVILPANDSVIETSELELTTDENGEPENFTWPPTGEPIIPDSGDPKRGEDNPYRSVDSPPQPPQKQSDEMLSDKQTIEQDTQSEQKLSDDAVQSQGVDNSSMRKSTTYWFISMLLILCLWSI